MRHQMPHSTDLLAARHAAVALAGLVPGRQVADALDRHYGKNGWFVFWDEDRRGRPVPGSIQLAYGKETVVIG